MHTKQSDAFAGTRELGVSLCDDCSTITTIDRQTVTQIFLSSALVGTFALVALLAWTTSALSQRSKTGGETVGVDLSGSVVDGESRNALTSATISLWSLPDSTLVTGAIAGRDGAFGLRGIRSGRYYLRISFIGYRTLVRDVAVAQQPVALGELVMSPDATLLDGVVVNAERDFMTVEIDRNVYSVEDMAVAAGGGATDVLRNIPSVDVDVDGNVSLRGNSNVAVQINGRPVIMSGDALANYLQSLPAQSIERVEVIANPSARYDPEGMGGILNIELKRGSEAGLSGGVDAGVGTNTSYNVGANIAYGSGPWNVSANYGLNARGRDMLGYRLQIDRSIDESSITVRDTGMNRSLGHSLNASIEYALDPMNALSASARLGIRSGRAERMSVTDYASTASDHLRQTDEDETAADMNYRLGYRWTGQRRVHELSADLRYAADVDDEVSLAARRPYGGAPADHRQSIALVDRNASADATLYYVRPLWDDARLEAGYSGSLRAIDQEYTSLSSDSTGGLTPDGGSNTFNFTERLHAVYAIVGQTIDDIDLQLGLRVESAATEFDLVGSQQSFARDYFSVFPSALIGYRPSDETQIRLSYAKRITRPRTRALNPFSTSTDPQFRRVGNPYLRPEYTHGIELSVNQFVSWGTLQFSPYVRRTVDAIERYERVDSSGVVTATFENLGQVDSYGAELLGTARLGDWLSTVGSIGLFKSVTDASSVGVDGESEALAWSARLTATANVGWETSTQASLFYRSPSDIVGGHSDAHVMSTFALTKTLLNNRAKIGLRVSDPFGLAGMSMWRETDGYYIENRRSGWGRSATLTFTYLFGQPKERTRGDRQMDAGDDDMEW